MTTLYPFEQLPDAGRKQTVWQYVQAIRQCKDRQHPIYQFFMAQITQQIQVDFQLYGLQTVEVEQLTVYDRPRFIMHNVEPIWAARLTTLFQQAHVPFLTAVQQHAAKAFMYRVVDGQFEAVQQAPIDPTIQYAILQQVMPVAPLGICTEHMTDAEVAWVRDMFEAQIAMSVRTVQNYMTLLLARAIDEVEDALPISEETLYWESFGSRFRDDTLLFTAEGQYICTFLAYMADDSLQQQFMLYDRAEMMDQYAYISSSV